ncbi:hypothetical protein K402DRAFT_359539 [Aulographum hederae CBS 113979]|uniref:EF-hand domain-containing protein n=1 Tax=Aulographum hederae CBS 113979 TaxID=1176131 RepID=A0A6G1GTR5_9PEZI|nr:hypothetical protein K402DRAFT_359539 [Aulographum hederae CBS 113979]
MSTPLRPSPLSFNNGRPSPFRRPESPLSTSSTVRASPTTSPLKPTPSSTYLSPTVSRANASTSADASWLSRNKTNSTSPPASPTHSPRHTSTNRPSGPERSNTATSASTVPPLHPQASPHTSSPTKASVGGGSGGGSGGNGSLNPKDPLASVPPQTLHTMRESFTVLDRSNAGVVTPADVADMLSQLGLDASSASLSTYFHSASSGTNQSINLSTYLSTLAADFTRLSRPDELLAAFSAFDDDDSGQVGIGELTDALTSVAGEDGRAMREGEVGRCVEGWAGRRAFAKGGKGGLGGGREEVFRYREFVGSVVGGNGGMAEGGNA